MKKHHEPLIDISKRATLDWWKAWLIRGVAILAALLVVGVLSSLITKANPFEIYSLIFEGSLGSSRRFWKLLHNLAILLCISIAVTPAFKMKFWNCGAEGQVLIGGLAAAACMIKLGDKLSYPMLIAVIVVAGIAAGAVWAVIPAIFKAHYNTNETLFTLMMNYVAMQLVSYFTYINAVPKGSGTISSIPNGHLPTMVNAYLLNILVVVVVTVGMFIYLKYSKQGYEIAVVGESQNTARYVGIDVKKVIIRTMLVSGAICGIAGILLVSGTDHTITSETVSGRGFTAIMVSWLAKFNPFVMILTSFLVVFLESGAGEVVDTFFLNGSYADIVTGIMILFIVGCEFFIQYTVKFRKSHKGGGAQ
ncbi:MAG: ABC transporter permease [Clostridia bacterium]|nr:ABC transporter permease [Clostridia bacterium]